MVCWNWCYVLYILTAIFAFLVKKATANANNGKNEKNASDTDIVIAIDEDNSIDDNLFSRFMKKTAKLMIKYLGQRKKGYKYLIIICKISLVFTLGIIYLISYSPSDNSFSDLD